jgi:hypothetical protein
MIQSALTVSQDPEKIFSIVSSQSMDDNLNQLMTRNYTQGMFTTCGVTDLTQMERDAISKAFGIASADIESADIAFMQSKLSVSMSGIIPTMRVNERMTQLLCMSPTSLVELVYDLWRLRVQPHNLLRKATPLWK